MCLIPFLELGSKSLYFASSKTAKKRAKTEVTKAKKSAKKAVKKAKTFTKKKIGK